MYGLGGSTAGSFSQCQTAPQHAAPNHERNPAASTRSTRPPNPRATCKFRRVLEPDLASMAHEKMPRSGAQSCRQIVLGFMVVFFCCGRSDPFRSATNPLGATPSPPSPPRIQPTQREKERARCVLDWEGLGSLKINPKVPIPYVPWSTRAFFLIFTWELAGITCFTSAATIPSQGAMTQHMPTRCQFQRYR